MCCYLYDVSLVDEHSVTATAFGSSQGGGGRDWRNARYVTPELNGWQLVCFGSNLISVSVWMSFDKDAERDLRLVFRIRILVFAFLWNWEKFRIISEEPVKGAASDWTKRGKPLNWQNRLIAFVNVKSGKNDAEHLLRHGQFKWGIEWIAKCNGWRRQ